MLMELRLEASEHCVSELALDEWRAGELAPEQVKNLEAHLEGCPRCRARKRSHDEQAAAFLKLAPRFEPQRSRPVASEKRRRIRKIWAWASALGAAAAVAAGAWMLPRPVDETVSATRLKGGPRLGFFVKSGARVRAGADKERVLPGDQLRFVVSTDAPRYLAILSYDARHVASVYYPPGDRTRLIGPGAHLALETGVKLDDALGTERLFGIFCERAIDVESLRQGLQKSGRLSAPSACSVDRISIQKVEPP